MAQIKMNTVKEVKEAAQSVVSQAQQISENQRSLFQSMMEQIQNINPSLGGFEELGALLAMPEKEFSLIAPIFLDELQKSMNNIDDKYILIQAMNVSGLKVEDLQRQYQALVQRIDEEFKDILSPQKSSFLKRMLGITYNCIADAEGTARRIVNIPIELISEDAKIPKYANLGDGAVDLYSPADYAIKPGETIIIPTDIKVALPYGYAFLIHPRSGLSAKSKLRVANSIGLIDSQYKGNIGVIIENIEPAIKDIAYDFDENGKPVISSIEHGKTYYIAKGERFAQMRLVEVPTASFYQVNSVEGIGDDRGGGFGSSGTN